MKPGKPEDSRKPRARHVPTGSCAGRFLPVAGTAITAILLGGCTTTGIAGAKPADWYCHAFQPLYWDVRDTAETVRQIREHNSVWDALCLEPVAQSAKTL